MKPSIFCADRIFGIFSVIVGILGISECIRLYPIANSPLSGDHVMLGITGVVLIILGLVLVIKPGKLKFTVSFPERATAFNMIGAGILLVVYSVLLEQLGFAASTAICGVFLFRLFGGYSWLRCVLAAAITAVMLHLVFVTGLGMAFPHGRLF